MERTRRNMKEGGSRSEVQRWKTGRGGPGLRGPGEETLWGGEEGKEKGASPLCRWEIRPEMPAAAATVEKRSTRSVVSFFSSARIIPLNGSVLLSLSLSHSRSSLLLSFFIVSPSNRPRNDVSTTVYPSPWPGTKTHPLPSVLLFPQRGIHILPIVNHWEGCKFGEQPSVSGSLLLSIHGEGRILFLRAYPLIRV